MVNLKVRCQAIPSLAYRTILPAVSIAHRSLGVSSVGLQLVGKGPAGCKTFELKTTAGTPVDVSLGVVRYGYYSPDDNQLASFVELGWDYFQSSGVCRTANELPLNKSLAVYVRWYRNYAGYICTIT